MDSTNLNEFVDLAPINLKEIGTISGSAIYSSDKIDAHIRTWIGKSAITRAMAGKIYEGMDSGRILLGYESKSKLKFLKTRWRDFIGNDNSLKGYVGYFDAESVKIAIVFDENINIIGKSTRNIPPILVHELCHYTAFADWKSFITKTMKPWLVPFYKHIWNNLDPKTKDIPDSDLIKAIIDVSRLTDHNFNTRPEISGVFEVWNRYLRVALDGDDSYEVLMKAFSPYYQYAMRSLKGENKKHVKPMIKLYADAYASIGADDILGITTPCQEVVYPSEVLCVANQLGPDPLMVRLINNVAMPKVGKNGR